MSWDKWRYDPDDYVVSRTYKPGLSVDQPVNYRSAIVAVVVVLCLVAIYIVTNNTEGATWMLK